MNERNTSLIFFALFILLTAGISIFSLQSSYTDAEDKAKIRVSNRSFLISEWIKSSFEITDYLLKDILGHVQTKEALIYPHPDPHEQQRLNNLITAKMKTVPNVILVGLFDQKCIVTHVNNDDLGFDASYRDYCIRLRDEPARETFVTNAFVSSTGPLNVTQSRRYLPAEKGFHGFAAVGVDLDFFSKLLEGISVGKLGVVAITDGNVRLLARRPATADTLGKRVNNPTVKAFIASGEAEKNFTEASPVDGVPRLYSIRKAGELPFFVIVGEADQDWQAEWVDRFWVTLISVMVLWCMAGIMLRTYLTKLENLGELKKARDQLESLSVTDPLTGLANRRRFEDVLESECRRLRRISAPISVIMIDVDFFKEFNDAYGHQAGDDCLKAVAKVLRANLKRTQDLAARYGGEEFICILPETNKPVALTLAENIRRGIEELAISHKGSPVSGNVTVSLGVTTVVCDAETIPFDVIKNADMLLYRSKENGRNRVSADP